MDHEPVGSRTSLPGYQALEKLALNLRWSWNHAADKIWEWLDAALWKNTLNPWIVLQTVSIERLEEALSDPEFIQLLNQITKNYRSMDEAKRWFQDAYPETKLSAIAYFSMEYMLCEALPIYSGGLGNVAGDQLKAASDLGVPVHAIGLLYQQGYFRQVVDQLGTQQALYPYNDPGQLPISPLRTANGEWLRLEASFPGFSIWLRTWKATVGNVNLYLLDSNDAANFPAHRGITSELYGGGSELRLKQELILGIGGVRLLKALKIEPEVCHLNEGHAAFAILERAYQQMQKSACNFWEALEATRIGNLFTTHTAVLAGFDRFSPQLIEEYLAEYAKNNLKITADELLGLGRITPKDKTEEFHMAYLALRGSGAANGVSQLHGEVSRKLFSPLFPRWPEKEVPIEAVTNGIHVPSWDSLYADNLWTGACGKNRWLGKTENLQEKIDAISDDAIWSMRNESRKSLINYVRERYSMQLASIGATREAVERAKRVFDPNTLTLCFARRFATYKRPNMLLNNPERLANLLKNPHHPFQLIIAGKAHPADKPGQEMIRQWIDFIKREDVQDRVLFLSDYDVNLTEKLVQGADLWINTPRRPWEACGTSGMKVLVNGGLNLSELDGWWAEAYTPEVGFAIGDGKEHDSDLAWDAIEAEQLYSLLENEIAPLFYKKNSEGHPSEWICKIRASMGRLTPQYSSNRSVREYTERFYIPLSEKYLKRTEPQAIFAKELLTWKDTLKNHWHNIRFGNLQVRTDDTTHTFQLDCYLDDISPDFVKVQLYAEANGSLPSEQIEMTRLKELPGSPFTYVYTVSIPNTRQIQDFTSRIIPYHPEASVPLECPEILWQH